MVTVYDVEAPAFLKKLADDLKTKIEAPDWSAFVKTGVSKERHPDDGDWWYVRAASVLRKLYIKGPLGVSKLRSEYKAKKNKGVRKERSKKASGKIIRTILQQLEKAGLVKKTVDKQGREISSKGRSYMDGISKAANG